MQVRITSPNSYDADKERPFDPTLEPTPQTCATCGGDGFVTRMPGDTYATEHVPCPDCTKPPCATCGGETYGASHFEPHLRPCPDCTKPAPQCARCGGMQEIQVGTGRPNGDGGEEWTTEPCPDCWTPFGSKPGVRDGEGGT